MKLARGSIADHGAYIKGMVFSVSVHYGHCGNRDNDWTGLR
ncbi:MULTISPECIES: hypothetical protein [unclassified Micromonospora]